MAKKVTTPIKRNNPDDFWGEDLTQDNYSHKKKSTVKITAIVVGVLALLIIAPVAWAYFSWQNGQKDTSGNDNSPSQQYQPSSPEPEIVREPISLTFSGVGMSSTEQFELWGGNYLLTYDYSNNAVHYEYMGDAGNNFISKLKCSDTVSSKAIVNDISISGSGSEYVGIRIDTKCFYQVKTSTDDAKWSITITSN
jgi:hypothetical protein